MLKLTALTFVLFLTLAAGCTTPDPVMAPDAGQGDLLPIEDYPQIVVTSGLAPYLAFGRGVFVNAPESPMSVQIPIRVLDELAVNIQYEFKFFDKNGRVLPGGIMRYERLPAKVQRFLTASALDTDAVDFRLTVRPAR